MFCIFKAGWDYGPWSCFHLYNTGKGIRLIFLNLEVREFDNLSLIGNERDDQTTR